jgi:hypothetical protein
MWKLRKKLVEFDFTKLGISQSNYCSMMGISADSLIQWRAKLNNDPNLIEIGTVSLGNADFEA